MPKQGKPDGILLGGKPRDLPQTETPLFLVSLVIARDSGGSIACRYHAALAVDCARAARSEDGSCVRPRPAIKSVVVVVVVVSAGLAQPSIRPVRPIWNLYRSCSTPSMG
ncbi:hypothetical protein DAI22_03g132200 [Oryza sativa Japonica Group]|nr:hypothetical protein DAI22_03g132200 [Oryza sativa Japonica Group]